MKLNELPDWPPRWQPVLLRSAKSISGELGALKTVSPLYASDDYLVLRIVHDGNDYTGLLHVDPIQKARISAILEEQKGRSIKETGQLEMYTEGPSCFNPSRELSDELQF
jgi:hypothetical protein